MDRYNIDSSQPVGEINGDRVKGDLNEDLNEYLNEEEDLNEEEELNEEEFVDAREFVDIIPYPELYNDYQILLKINEKLLTKSLKEEDIDDFENLFLNLNKKPKLSLLGQSGAGKSTLINKIIKESILESSSGKGAVTQYPVELIYDEKTRFELVKNIDIEDYELNTILTDKLYVSEYFESLDKDSKLIEEIYTHIDIMNKWEISYSEKKKKFIWKDFNKKINGNVNDKYHFEYKTIINEKEVSIWINVSPFIKKLSIYLKSDILKDITLVDLPGLYDKSEVRTRKTKGYLENETDFIMIVENNDRAATSQFIDRSLNSYILNIIVKKQIPDILLVLTNIDRTYESSLKDFKDDSDDSDDEDTLMSASDEFKNRLNHSKMKISSDIKENESLKKYEITDKNINIIFYSSKKSIDKVLGKNTIDDVLNSIIDTCDKRKKRYISIITDLIKDQYNDIKDYVNKETVQEEEINKIKEILTCIKKEIIRTINVNIKHDKLLVSDSEFNKILISNETYSNILRNRNETHGLTLWATLRKMIHESTGGELYNLVEDLSEEYISFWKENYTDFIKIMNKIYYTNNKVIDQSDVFKKLKDINGIDDNDIIQLKRKIKRLFVSGNGEVKFKRERYISYEKFLEKEGIIIIEYNVRNNILKYHILARGLSGEGSSKICRGYITEMLSIENNMKVKQSINEQIQNIFADINDTNKKVFYDKLDDIFNIFCNQYEEEEGVDVDGINKLLNQMINEY